MPKTDHLEANVDTMGIRRFLAQRNDERLLLAGAGRKATDPTIPKAGRTILRLSQEGRDLAVKLDFDFNIVAFDYDFVTANSLVSRRT